MLNFLDTFSMNVIISYWNSNLIHIFEYDNVWLVYLNYIKIRSNTSLNPLSLTKISG